MSDRTSSSVRTGSREETSVVDAPAAPPADDARPPAAGGATAAGAAPVAGAPGAAPQVAPNVAGAPPAAGRPDVSPDGPPRPAGAAARQPGAVDATAAVQRPVGAAAGGGGGKARGPAARGPRRARLQLRHIDTWSALKISLVVSIALFFVWMVAVGVLFGVLNGLGVFQSLNELIGTVGSASGSGGGGEVITAGLVFGGAAVIGLVNIVLLTALCTISAVVYNLCSDLVGGVEVTLSERD
jgi:hypothetical protein